MKRLFLLFLPVLFLAACENSPAPTQPAAEAPRDAMAPAAVQLAVAGAIDGANASLEAAGAPYRVAYAEYVTGAGADEIGQTVFANDRQLRLSSQWVPGDARRVADGDLITFMNYAPLMVANGVTPAEAAVDAAFATWDDLTCSNLDVVKRPWDGFLNSALLTTGIPALDGDPFAADIVTIGFLSGALFDVVLGPGASGSVLGVTFTAVFITGPGGPPTDVNGDGYADTALKEVWYNNAFPWSTTGGPGIDIETVAFHENGHALGLGHFGKVFRTNKNGKLHIAPRAAMNAFIFGEQRDPLGTDNASYCSLYGAWPN